MSPRRNLRDLAAGLLVLAVMSTVIGPLLAASPAAASQPDDPLLTASGATPIRLASVSPWVEPDGTWTARFQLTGSVPLDATLRVSIRRPLGGDEGEVRQRLAEIRRGEELTSPLQSDLRLSMADVLTPEALTIDLPIRPRAGDASRILVPNPGVHPVIVELDAADGTVLHREVLFLNRAPTVAEGAEDEEQDVEPLQLNLFIGLHSTTTVNVESTWSLTEAAHVGVDRAVQLLDAHPSLPVSLTPDPDLVAALAASPDPTDQSLLQRLSTVLVPRETLRSPWAPLDTEAWATTGRLADLQTAMALGQQTLVVATRSEPNGRSWVDDPTVGPGSLPRLTDVGVERLVVESDQLDPVSSSDEDPGTTRSFTIEGGGERLTAATIDPTIAGLLGATDRPAVAVAHDTITELQAIWFAASSATTASADVTPGAIVDIGAGVPTENVAALLDVLGPDHTPIVEPTDLDSWFERTGKYEETVSRRTEPLVRTLTERTDVPDIRPLSIYLGAFRGRAAAYHSTMSDPPELVPLDQLLAASQGRDLGEPEMRARLDAAALRIDTDLSAISAPTRRAFTVTSRRATLPLQFGNGLDRAVRVEVRFVGARLEIEGGNSQILELQPGVTKVDLPVVARTSGQFEIVVQMRTADGALVLSRTEIRVRSTAFSGVGLLLGGGALAFLAVWWIRTLRRERRRRGPDEPEPAATEPEPAQPDPSLA